METRLAILNFLADNKTELDSINYTNMTICLYGKENILHPLNKYAPFDSLFIYQVLLPRIYEKKYDLSYMNNGVLAVANTLDSMKIYNKTDFLFQNYTEPYQNKIIDDLTFNYLYIVPLVQNNLHIGCILIYSNTLNNNFLLSKQSITGLLNNLYYSSIKELLILLSQTLGIVYKDNYCLEYNNSFEMFNGIKDIKKLDVTNNEISLFVNDPKTIKTTINDINLYYTNQSSFDINSIPIYDISVINEYIKKEEFSLICFSFYNQNISINEFLKNINIEYKYDCFKTDSFYCVLINTVIHKPLINHMFSDFKEYFILITSNMISKNSNLIRLVNYLKKEKPFNFKLKDYENYLTYLNEEALFIDSMNKEHTLINSLTLDKTLVLNSIINKSFNVENLETLEKNTLKLIKKAFLLEENVCISIPSTLLYKKKLIDLYKDLNLKNEITYFIHYDESTIHQDFYNGLLKAVSLGIKIIVDSSLFFNLNYLDLQTFFNGIYLNNVECALLQNNQTNIFRSIVEYYLSHHLMIVLSNKDILKHNDRFISYIL